VPAHLQFQMDKHGASPRSGPLPTKSKHRYFSRRQDLRHPPTNPVYAKIPAQLQPRKIGSPNSAPLDSARDLPRPN